jgi:HAD superfamily hydrolase (TIGR01509 family)
MPSVSLICFDLGGVIVRHCRNWAEGCAAAGLPLHQECIAPDVTARRRGLSTLLTTGRIDEPEFYRQMSITTGGRYSPEQVRAIHHSWLGAEYEGVHSLISSLVTAAPSRGIRTAVLSNTNTLHWARLETAPEYPTPRLIPERYASHLLGLAKPDPAIFQEFQARTGMPPDRILFFDDLPDNIAAARAAGWNTVQVDHTGDTAAQIRLALRRFGVGVPGPDS